MSQTRWNANPHASSVTVDGICAELARVISPRVSPATLRLEVETALDELVGSIRVESLPEMVAQLVLFRISHSRADAGRPAS